MFFLMQGPDLLPKINATWRVPIILIVTGLLSVLSVVFSVFDGSGRLQHWCAQRWSDFIFFVSRVRVDVEGLEKLSQRRGYVLVANHLSMFDHWAFLSFLPFQFRFAAKSSLFKIPFLGWHLRRSGNLPVYFGNPRQTLKGYQEVAKTIHAGISLVIYPEGGRTFDGVMKRFKRGPFLLARTAEAPIVPVTIIGAHLRLKRGSIVIRPGTMRLIIHDPLEYEEYKDEKLEDTARRVQQTIALQYRLDP
jgi:1-acyl-sn-glycerol-3-phosphate acyltransferase